MSVLIGVTIAVVAGAVGFIGGAVFVFFAEFEASENEREEGGQ